MNQNIENRNAGWMWIAFGLVLVVVFFGFMLLSMHNTYRGGYGMGWGSGSRAGYWNHMPMYGGYARNHWGNMPMYDDESTEQNIASMPMYSGQSWSDMPMYNSRYAGHDWSDMPMYNGRYAGRNWSDMPMYDGRYAGHDWSEMPMYNILNHPENTTQSNK
ncbi:hypothetical protein [Acinetobacter sp. MB5]|uniref:hypothetical protein n=1 Tax=Acinetobacter sp. MB5 TaxID=2069438 RepID=UPI000DD04950|nr:hypothetical protein [Acinetobacter sp. MB5]